MWEIGFFPYTELTGDAGVLGMAPVHFVSFAREERAEILRAVSVGHGVLANSIENLQLGGTRGERIEDSLLEKSAPPSLIRHPPHTHTQSWDPVAKFSGDIFDRSVNRC